jgi:hypothetical protein
MSAPSRVFFRERQLLRAADLQTEQQYLLGLAGRHHVAPHVWGIVRGLSMSLQGDVATVRPGLAIDGYGRELAIFQPVQLDFSSQSSTQYVYVYYCERLKGACGAAPNPRFLDSAEVQVTATNWPIPSNDPDLTLARAAGTSAGAAPWPVLLGIIKARKNNIFHVQYSHCIYTRLHASLICSPAGGTVVRVGAENLADPYDLRISLRDAAKNLQKRFAIDREGNAIFWGNLIITSAQRGAVLPTLKEGVFLKAQVKSDVGGAVRVQSIFSGGKQSTLALHFRVNFVSHGRTADDVLHLDSSFTAKQMKQAISNFNKTSSSVLLKELVDLNPPRKGVATRSRIVAAPPAKSSTPIFDDRELPVGFAGADLSFVPEDIPTPPPCDCLTAVDNPELLPEGFIFLPGTDPPAPPARDIYSLHLEPKDLSPSDEVRISGGTKKDGDFSRRITVSGQHQDAFVPLLTFRGNGSLALPGDLNTSAVASHLLRVVGGTTQLPIVKPDPRDPLFNYLLVLAFIQGVMSASSALIKVDFTELPEFIEPQLDWSYKFSLQNLSSTDSLQPDKCSEMLVGDSLAVLGTISGVTSLLPSASQGITVKHSAGQIPTGTHSLQIEINTTMKLGNASVAGKKRSDPVAVLQTPTIDFSDLPSTATAIMGVSFFVGVANSASRSLKVSSMLVQIGAPPAAPLTFPHGDVQPGQTLWSTNQATIPAQGVGNVTVTVTILYQWNDTTSKQSSKESKTVTLQ